MPEEPIHAVITARFDLGFILEHPNGRSGELRVPEMSRSTAEFDRSSDANSGIGSIIQVYVVRENGGEYLFSEFSIEERSARDKMQERWIKAQEQAKVGNSLDVRVEHKHEWGCICRQESEPFLEGVIATIDTVRKNRLPTQCATTSPEWERLAEGQSYRW